LVFGIQPEETLSASSLSVGGAAYATNFGSYTTPSIADAGC
jgi:hypothetical protein